MSKKAVSSKHSNATSPAASSRYGAICKAIDPANGLDGFNVSYISQSKSEVLKSTNSVVKNHVVIMPAAGSEKPSGHKLSDRLVDFGVDCGLAVPLAYSAASAACGSTITTVGLTAPLCAFAAAGAATASLKCGTAISKMAEYGYDPSLLDVYETDEHWKTYETAVDTVDTISNVAGAYQGIKDLGKLTKLTSKYGKNIVGRVSKHESKVIFRDIARQLGDVVGNKQTRQWLNSKGLSHRYNPQMLNRMMEKTLRETGLAVANTYDNAVEFNNRYKISNEYPKRTLMKDSARPFLSSFDDEPPHTTIIFQQFEPN